MFGKIVLIVSALALAKAQIPSLGWCPEYVPMANFNMERFLGVWYEAERYFQLSEVVSRCVMVNYTRGADGKLRVSNEVTNRFTGIKRILEGEIKPAASKAEEGKLHVKYTIPLTPETKYSVLETDYDNYAVLWSCSGIGPLSAQNAWVMTRMRLAPGEILQKAYGVLDKYKISKTFFVKTDQDDCSYVVPLPPKEEAAPENAEKGNVKSVLAVEEPEDSSTATKDSSANELIKEPAIEADPAAETLPDLVPKRILAVANAVKLGQQDESEKETVLEQVEKVEEVEQTVEEKAPEKTA